MRVLVDDDRKVVVESCDICEQMLARAGRRLVPFPWEGAPYSPLRLRSVEGACKV